MAGISEDITELRVAAYPLGADTRAPLISMLANPASMWQDNTVGRIQMAKFVAGQTAEQNRNAIWAEADGWKGMDGPTMEVVMSGYSAGDGKETTTEKVAERNFLIPMNEEIGDGSEYTKLTNQLFRGQYRTGTTLHNRRIAMGFRRETLDESRYLLGVRYRTGLDRPWRGNATRSSFKPRFTAEWGFAVQHHSVAAGDSTGALSGLGDIIYGLTWTTAPSGTRSLTIDGTTYTITFPAGLAANGILCPSPPFRHIPAGITFSTALPLYMRPSATATTAPAGTSLFWLENFARV